MGGISPLWLLAGALVPVLGVLGLRGLVEIREALRLAELDRLAAPDDWRATRALLGALCALPVWATMASFGPAGLLIGALVAVSVYALAPQGLIAVRRRVERRILDELATHLDLIALAMECGSTWTAALVSCTERAPDGPLRRAWGRVILEIQAGMDPLDALRGLEQRVRLRPFATLVSALRAAEKLQQPLPPVLRERARQAAASRFARAERSARAAPLKLWAAMVLCLAPCTALVLAFPLSGLLARWLA